MCSFSISSWILYIYLCGSVVQLPTLQAIWAIGLDEDWLIPLTTALIDKVTLKSSSNYGPWIRTLSHLVSICNESQRLSIQVLKLIICMSCKRSYWIFSFSLFDYIAFPIEITIASRMVKNTSSTYFNLIVTHFFFVSICKYKLSHPPFKYRCWFKKSDHIRHTYLSWPSKNNKSHKYMQSSITLSCHWFPNKSINNQRRAIWHAFEPIGPIMLKIPIGARWGALPTLWWVGSWLPTYLASLFLSSREKISQRETNR